MDWRFRLALRLAEATGCRIGSIRKLRWSDIDLDNGQITWRAENDKIGMGRTVPLLEDAVEALREARRESQRIGDSWVFPSPGDPERETSRHLFRDWWERAEKLAGLTPTPRRGWHSLRRKFATEMMHQPLKLLCELGGWKNHHTVVSCYQRADRESMERALADRRKPMVSGG